MGDAEGERRRLRGGSGGEEERSGPVAAAGLVASGLELGISAEAMVAWGGLVWSGWEGDRRTREKMGSRLRKR